MTKESLTWEGITWTLVTDAHSTGFPIKCDGCEAKIHNGSVYRGDDGSEALWCKDCVETVEAAD